jgi:type I restriction enzyme M protein
MKEQLDTATLKKYGDLAEADVKGLVLDDKWQAEVTRRVVAEVDSLTLDLVARIGQLGDRYAQTVSVLDARIAVLEGKVAGHLAAMGVSE